MDFVTWLYIIILGIPLLLFIWHYILYPIFHYRKLDKELSKKNLKISELTKEHKDLLEEIVKLKEEIEILSLELKDTKSELQHYLSIQDDSALLNDSDKDGSSTNYQITSALDEEQLKIYDLMENSFDNLFITGGAGTGKSFLLNTFKKNTKKKAVILSPTGISALNVGGVTLHSFFGYNNIEHTDSLNLSDNTILSLKATDVIIIDEISMVRADKLDKINLILQKVWKNDEAFGGIQMIFFGDVFQLSPIAKSEELDLLKKYDTIFFFSSDAYKKANFRFCELTINHRQQSDKQYYDILNRIRSGTTTQEDIDTLNTRVFDKNEIPNRITALYPMRSTVKTHNEREYAKIPKSAKEYTYYASIEAKGNITESQLPVSFELKLKVGAIVMFVKNGPQWKNGTIGIVSKLSKNYVYVTIDGVEVEVFPEKFAEQEIIFDKYTQSITYRDKFRVYQYPLALAYAITIHKSQGKTFPRLSCDVSQSFSCGQVYVALSRCSSLKGLYLQRKIKLQDVNVNNDALDFYLKSKETDGSIII